MAEWVFPMPGPPISAVLCAASVIRFAIDSQIAQFQRPDVAVRPMEAALPPLTTYLLHSAKPSPPLERSIERTRRVGGLTAPNEKE